MSIPPLGSIIVCSNIFGIVIESQNSSAYNSDNYWSCIHDCCLTNACLFPHFGIHMANSVVPTTVPAAGQSGNTGKNLWQKLRGSCKDTFNLQLCQSLKVIKVCFSISRVGVLNLHRRVKVFCTFQTNVFWKYEMCQHYAIRHDCLIIMYL